jgi:hypothetical protein
MVASQQADELRRGVGRALLSAQYLRKSPKIRS